MGREISLPGVKKFQHRQINSVTVQRLKITSNQGQS